MYHNLPGCGQKEEWEKQTEDMHPGVSCATSSGRKKTIFSEFICSRSNDASESDHSLDVCTMCQRGNCICRCLVETRFHQAVMRLLLMKYHISSSGIVWGFFDGIFQSFVRFYQNANHIVDKEETRRARLMLAGGRVRPSLC